jgi:uncharacterized protein (DUF983 family)
LIGSTGSIMTMPRRDSLLRVLRRGLRRRCPRCGEGQIFRRGIEINKRCSECDLLLQRNYGDTWIFMMITDRIPMLFGIAALYFGFVATSWTGAAILFVALAAPMLATIRERQGLALALDYLSRVYLRDPSDEIHSAAMALSERSH